jgi:hypothetical protein
LDRVTNEFDNTIRATPTRWTEECWREVYNFSTGGGGLAGRKDEYVKDCFKELPSPKDRYAIEDCSDPRHRRVLAFLVPILYPEKPNRITVTLGNTIFGALNGGRKVNWVRIITNLVIQLAARVGKSRASSIYPFLYHLYERKELLKLEEEKQWKVQEAMMKSGSSNEDGSGSDDETEDKEEEEDCQVLLNRVPKRPRQEERSATLTPKVEGVPVTTSQDRFEAIVKALDEMQGEHRMRGELLRVVCQLVDCTPTSLPDRIRKMMADQSQVEDSKMLRQENAKLNLEVGTLRSENQAAKKQAEAALAAAERIQTFAHQAGEVVAKVELFDKKVRIGSKPSGNRIAMILTDYSEKLEQVLEDIREVVDHVTSLRRQLERQDLAASSSKGVPNLSKLSLPDSFSKLPNVEDYVGVDVMPESKGVQEPKDTRKDKSPRMKHRDVVMTSASKEVESGSGGDRFPIPDLHQRRALKALSPDQETAGFVTPKMTK